MDEAAIVELIKANLGILSTKRDAYFTAIVESIIEELTEEKGIILVPENMNHTMFIVDYAVWRYQNRDNKEGMPRNLSYRLRNIYVHNGGGLSDV